MNQRHAQWRTLRAQGWSQQAIADRYGVTRQAVSLVVGGPQKPARHGTNYKYRQGCHCEICVSSHQNRLAPQRPPPSHGTTARYKRGCHCDACREASTEANRQRQARARRRGRPIPHGTTGGYTDYKCRCDACRAAKAAAWRAYKQRRHAKETASHPAFLTRDLTTR